MRSAPCHSAGKGLYLVLFINDYPFGTFSIRSPRAYFTSAATPSTSLHHSIKIEDSWLHQNIRAYVDAETLDKEGEGVEEQRRHFRAYMPSIRWQVV
jgi:hypothetical protein